MLVNVFRADQLAAEPSRILDVLRSIGVDAAQVPSGADRVRIRAVAVEDIHMVQAHAFQ